MTTLTRVQELRYGLHTAGDFTAVPGSLKHLRPAGTVIGVGRSPAYVDRDDYATSTGARLPGFQAGQELELPDLPIEVRGLSDGGALGAVNSSTLGLEIDEMMQALCGAAGVNAVGQGTAASPGTGTSVTAAASVTTTGVCARLIPGADGKYHARIQLSATGSTITLDRALRTDANGSLNPAATTDMAGGRLFTVSPSAADGQLLFFDFEDADSRLRAYGCLGSAGFSFERGGRVVLSLTGLSATLWDTPARATPTYAAASRGLPVRVLSSPLFIGADLFQATVDAVDLGVQVTPRESDHAPNGAWGYVRASVAPTMTGTIRGGASTTPLEVTAALLASLRSDDSTQDILYQAGREPGRAMCVRFPAADLRIGAPVDAQGQKVYPFEARATDGTAQIAFF